MRRPARIAICAFLSFAGGAASAAQLTWSLAGGKFADGGTLSGTFVLDLQQPTPSTWTLNVAGGGSSFPAHSYTPLSSTVSRIKFPLNTQQTFRFLVMSGTREMRLTPASALDGSLGSVPLVLSSTSAVECFGCTPFRYITAGSLLLTSAKPAVTLVSVIPDPTIVGANTTATVLVETVAALGAPTGTINVLDEGNTTVCTIVLPANTSCAFAAPLTSGGKTLHAQYSGGSNYTSAASNTLSYTVLPAVTTTVTLVSVTPDPTTVGATTTAAVTVATVPPLGAPTGTVEVLDGNDNSLCTLTLPAPSCTFIPTIPGNRTVVAQYSGDVSYASGLSNVLPLTIGPVTTTATLVSVAPNPTAVGAVTTATVSIATVAPFDPPTGTVTVLDDVGNPLCAITLPAESCTFTPTTPGDITAVAVYDGDANYEGALSNELPLTILPITPVRLQSFEVE